MTAPRIALLTGRSDPARTGLPPVQEAFLEAVVPPGMIAVGDGYPWTGGAPERPVPLPLAALRNAAQWRAARSGAARAEVSARLARLKGDPLAIVTGSCGLDLLVCGWVPGLCDLVIALGPVRRRPAWAGVRIVTVVGRRDALARAFHRERPDIVVPCGHMSYWACPATRDAVARVLGDWRP
ncbi:hypothetical protein [Histidinibacterium lentulum]|uniref:Alpha/beta hydrolase n=1 Tax=Histidinibacterium lentulum TaxID=2480588 RepID=A0A3N2R8W1_9RHOB|nr:hypothetical protein [Histidinibacterium lentulum]ROU03909.1 hypothetical protein EAT49_00415 [Histidinibacterium lentulum]